MFQKGENSMLRGHLRNRNSSGSGSSIFRCFSHLQQAGDWYQLRVKLQTLTPEEWTDIKEIVCKNYYFEFGTSVENTGIPRHSKRRQPSFVLKYMQFEARVMRDVDLEKKVVDDSLSQDKPPIVHSGK